MTVETAIAIIGGGIAGLSAALRAGELGATATVFEQSADEFYPCNSRMTGGVFHVAFNSVEAPPSQLKQAIMSATYGAADGGLAELIGEEIGPAMGWLRRQGAHLIRTQAQPYYSAILAPPGLRKAGVHWKGYGGDRLLRNLAGKLEAHGRLERGVRIVDAQREPDGRFRLAGRRPDGDALTIFTKAIIFADGGFAGNQELVKAHISSQPQSLCARGAGTGLGYGVTIGGKLGAKLKDLDRFYGHVQARAAVKDQNLWPYPVVDHVATAAIVVDSAGRRFLDEGRGGVFIANQIACAPDPLGSFVICDESIWQGPGRAHRLPPNPSLPRAGGDVVTADTLEHLAHRIGVPAANLEATVDEHNRMLRGEGEPAVPRSRDRFAAWPVQDAPFHAIPVAAGITYTMGGLVIDAEAAVLDDGDRKIPGLFAAGATTAGLEGGPFAGYTGGLSKSLVLGLKAAESASLYAAGRGTPS